MTDKLPTTVAELRIWLAKQPEFKYAPKAAADEIVNRVLSMIRSDAEIPTFLEGWFDARNGTVDPNRMNSSLQSLKDQGRI